MVVGEGDQIGCDDVLPGNKGAVDRSEKDLAGPWNQLLKLQH